MNREQYKEALRHAEQLERKINDLLDDKKHETSRSLMSEARCLVDELENNKNPRSLENRIKSILNILHHVESHGDALLDFRHGNMLHHEYEHLMMSLRKFDNY